MASDPQTDLTRCRSKKFFGFGVVTGAVFFAAALVEFSLQAQYRFDSGGWLWVEKENHKNLFEQHPLLGGVTRQTRRQVDEPNIHFHPSVPMRGRAYPSYEGAERLRIAALGGSTTFGSAKNEGTWPLLLEASLGNNFEVFNLGVPGFTTVENLIQTALHLPELQAKVAIYFEGWNDARNTHILNLKSDYSDFHLRTQLTNLRLGSAATLLDYSLLWGFIKRDYLPRGRADALTANRDERALSFYRRNLISIIALCRQWGITPLFVPQVMNPTLLFQHKPSNWVPLINDDELIKVISYYNGEMREVAQSYHVEYVEEVLGAFEPIDFFDQGHFNRKGNEKFVAILEPKLRQLAESRAEIQPHAESSGPRLEILN